MKATPPHSPALDLLLVGVRGIFRLALALGLGLGPLSGLDHGVLKAILPFPGLPGAILPPPEPKKPAKAPPEAAEAR